MKHYCKVKIISRRTKCGILAPCYVGNWRAAKGVTIELHKFWFCHDDQNRCVGGIRKEYAIGRPIVPSLWPVQERTNLTQDEVMTLKKAGFLLSRKAKCHPRNLFGDSSSFPINKPADATAWLTTRNGKNICRPSIFKIST
jgi:hypothetical protein